MKKDKKQTNGGIPLQISLSYDDKYIVEVLADSTGATILMRSVIQNLVVAKFEGHSQQI